MLCLGTPECIDVSRIQEGFERGGAGSSKRQVRRNFQTDKQKKPWRVQEFLKGGLGYSKRQVLRNFPTEMQNEKKSGG